MAKGILALLLLFILAGLAVGFYESREELQKNNRQDRLFTPSIGKEKREELYKGWKQAVKATCAFHEE